MAVTPRKGDAASVRRQSRQRLRSDRRYRRNRFLLFYRHLVRTGSAFPRLPRRFAPRNDKSDSFAPPNYCCKTCDCQWRSLTAATDAIGFHHFIDTRYESFVRSRARLSAPLQRTAEGLRIFHSSFFSFQDSFPCARSPTTHGWRPCEKFHAPRFTFSSTNFPFPVHNRLHWRGNLLRGGKHAWNRSCAVCPTGPTRAR